MLWFAQLLPTHVTPGLPQTFKVNGSKVNVIA